MTTRREVLQGIIISLGGATALSACGGVAQVLPSGSGALRYFSAGEHALVARLSDLIIPRTDTPGALDVEVPGFLDGLMAEWASTATRQRYRQELEEISRMLGENFMSLSRSAAEQQLEAFDAAAYAGSRPAPYSGYRNLKGLITQAYFASADGALQEQGWVAVPGRWDPCVEI